MKSFAVLLATALCATASPTPHGMTELTMAQQPGVPSESTASSELDSLRVESPGSMDGYSREKFPHWISQGNSCDTREVVLARDGTNVQQGSDCSADSGSWVSPYDGATWTDASDVDIDHMVPLANAWISGASSWSTEQRQNFANDLDAPQLWTVTDNVNQSKGDRSPDEWKPPSEDFYCTYAEAYIRIKSIYDLSITDAEKSALSDMLGYC